MFYAKITICLLNKDRHTFYFRGLQNYIRHILEDLIHREEVVHIVAKLFNQVLLLLLIAYEHIIVCQRNYTIHTQNA